MFEDYGTSHTLFAPKQAWVAIDATGIVQWIWRAGDLSGYGTVPMPRRWRFRDARIGLEVIPTGAAVRTYNILFGERRNVGAALIAVD